MIRLEANSTVFSSTEINRRGLTLICQNLAGEFVYSATASAWNWVKSSFSCQYLNDNEILVEAA